MTWSSYRPKSIWISLSFLFILSLSSTTLLAQFINYQGHATTRGLTNAPDQTIWANAGNGLLHYDLNGNLIEVISRSNSGDLTTPASTGTDVTIAPNGDIWTAAGYGSIQRYDGNSWTIFNSQNTPALFQGNSIDNIEAGPDGAIYALSYSNISVYRNGEWQTYNLGVFSNGANAIGFSPAGELTIALGRGLATWTPEFGIQFIVGGVNSTLAIYDFQYLDNGDLYYSTSNGGINRIPVGSTTPTLIAQSVVGFPRIAVESDGTIWVGTFSQGGNIVQRWTGNSWFTYTPSNSTVSTSAVTDIMVDANDNLYLSQGYFTDDEGLQRFDGNNWDVKYEGFVARGNNSLEQGFDEAGNLYTIGGKQLISKLNPTTGAVSYFHRANSPIQGNVRLLSLTATGNNQFWIGTQQNGIYYYNGNSWTNYTTASTNGQIPTNNIEAIKAAPDGTIYALAKGFSPSVKWLVRFQPNTQTWNNYAEGTDLPEDVNNLYVDAQGIPWVTSFNGLTKLENNTITIFTTDNSDLADNYTDYITGRPDGSEVIFRGRNTSSTAYFTFDGQLVELYATNIFGGFNGGFSPQGDYFYGGDIFGSGGLSRYDGTDNEFYNRNDSYIVTAGGGGVLSDPTNGVWYFNETGVVRYTGDDNDPLTINLTKTDITCRDENDGSINVSISGGTPPYQLLFQGEIYIGNNFTFNNLGVNFSYDALVIDANGITIGDNARIFNPSLINPNIIVSGTTITTNVTGGILPYTFLWNDGSTGPSINNAVPGTYVVTITDSNGCTAVGSVNVSNMPNDYCASKGEQPWESWIHTVFIGGINNNSGKSQYSNFTGQASTGLRTGTTREITLVADWSYFTWDVYWRVWIDYNQNGVFEGSELAVQTITNAPAAPGPPTPVFANITVPQSATLGATRMRVSMKQGAYPDPCETFTVGEVEDYTVVIEAGTNGPICPLTGTTSNFTCDDNGTPNNPGDDLYYFDATISAATPNPNSQWRYNNNVYPYNVPVNFGPFPIAGGDEILYIRDINSTNANSCELFLYVDLPIGPCSDGTPPTDDCDNNILTNSGFENGATDWRQAGMTSITTSNTRTGNQAALLGIGSSRFFRSFSTSAGETYTLKAYLRSVSGDKNAGISIKYMTSGYQPILNETTFVSVGTNYTLVEKTETAPANTAFIEVSIRGYGSGELVADDICLTTSTITPDCALTATFANKFCADNATVDNPSDDQFYFDIVVTGTNTSASWIATGSNQTITGPYGSTRQAGPFPISGGAVTLTIVDNEDPDCQTTMTVTPTATCSENNLLPDLLINTTGTLSGAPDEVVGFTFDLTNAGDATVTGDYRIGFVLSTDASLSSDDAFVGEVPTGNTGVGTISNVPAAITIPANLAAGDYFLIGKVDFDDAIEESNESNNVIVRAFTVSGTPPTGEPNCAASSDFPWHEWVSSVAANGIEKTSGKKPYSDFTNTFLSFTKDNNNSITLTAKYSYVTADAYWRVWIDYNQNDIYETNELFFEQMVPAPASGSGVTSTATGTGLSIPNVPLTGDGVAKMRVVLSRDGFAEACGDIPFGEVEDYSALLMESSASTHSEEFIFMKDRQLVGLSPNPTMDQVTIGLEKVQGQSFELMIVNQLGQVMFQQAFSENADRQVTLSTKDFATGLYLVWLNRKGQRSVPQKLIKLQW